MNIFEAQGNISSGNQGNVMQQSNLISLNSAGTHKVYVGIVLMPGNYFMNIDFLHGGTGMLHRAVTGASYPYAVSNVISLDSVDYVKKSKEG